MPITYQPKVLSIMVEHYKMAERQSAMKLLSVTNRWDASSFIDTRAYSTVSIYRVSLTAIC